MKKLTIASLIASSLFANYVQEKKGHIDMHGGKGDKLMVKGLSNIKINSPISPFTPKALIKEKKTTIKKDK